VATSCGLLASVERIMPLSNTQGERGTYALSHAGTCSKFTLLQFHFHARLLLHRAQASVVYPFSVALTATSRRVRS